jgi:hypothetical protein
MRELTFFRCDCCDEVFGIPSAAFGHFHGDEDQAGYSAHLAFQHVIDPMEGKTRKRKPH